MIRRWNRNGLRWFRGALLLGTVFCLGAEELRAQVQSTSQAEAALWQRSLDTLVIKAQPLVEVGVPQTRIDSLSLATVVSASLADVLSQSSTLFIKSYGRGTLATASFRGTAPSHTQVTWNGMKLNSPMLGMVDFSLIPSYFIDGATLYHGAGSVNVTAGGLGGAVALETKSTQQPGLAVSLVQGVSSFHTWDEFVKCSYAWDRWQSVTRVAYAHSKNDYAYVNYRKMGYPTERNKNGSYADLNAQQDVFFSNHRGLTAAFSVWLTSSERGVPLLNVDYKDQDNTSNVQDENTLRAVVSATQEWGGKSLTARAGYTYTDLSYIFSADPGSGEWLEMVHSQSYVNSAFGKIQWNWTWNEKWFWSADVSLNQHFVQSSDRSVMLVNGQKATVGYDKARAEYSGYTTVKYRPIPAVGLSLSLREELYGKEHTPLIPAFFADVRLSKKGNVKAKVSVARNYRYPTLNDLYFMPGGNDTLQAERGFTYDAGVTFALEKSRYRLSGECTAYNAQINNWIVWLPTFKGFWSPVNVKRVHSYGVECKAKAWVDLKAVGALFFDGNFAWTRSINHGDPLHWADESIGKQLAYIPEFSGAFTVRYEWRRWRLNYQWTYYSERFTTSSSERTLRYSVMPPYFMNGITLEKSFSFPKKIASQSVQLLCKLVVNNLFDEAYESVLSRPMPGRNYGLFLEFTF